MRLSLKSKFFLRNLGILVILSFITLFIFTVFALYVHFSYLIPIQDQNAELKAVNVSDGLGNDFHEFDTFIVSSTVSSARVSIQRLLYSQHFDYDDLIVFNSIKDQIAAICNRSPFVQEIAIWFENDQNAYFSHIGKFEIPPNCPWFESYEEHRNDLGWWTVVGETERFDGTPVRTIYLCRRFGGGGMFAAAISPDILESTISRSFIEEDEYLSITSPDGNVLISSMDARAEKAGEYLAYSTLEENSGWKITLFVPKSTVYELPRHYVFMMLTISLVDLVVSFSYSLFMTRRNTKRIAEILDIIHRAEQGLPLPQPKDSGEGTTYAYISQHMLTSLLEQDYLKSQLEIKKYKTAHAELVAMQSQLNPHFLYNTLETLNWKCYQLTGGPNQANVIIEKLSDILRYSLGGEGLFVTLAEEMEYIHSYIDIQNIRYMDMIRVREKISDEALGWRVPRMLLQPIVENAVQHGLRPKGRSGLLSIETSIDEGILTVSIFDDGVGISPENLDRIKKELGTDEMHSRHIGLGNVNTRLRTLYNQKLEIESEEAKGTTVILHILEKEVINVSLDDR